MMNKEITSRMKYISELCLFEKTLTLEILAEKMGISLRQIRYDIKRINEYFKDSQNKTVLETDNKGKIIVNDRECLKIMINSNENDFKFSKQQRIDVLVLISAFNIEKMNLTQLSKEINISRMTIKSDLECLKKRLRQYQLELKYENCFYLCGDEHNLYEYRLDALYMVEYTLYKDELEKNEIMMREYTIESFNHVQLRKILPIIHDFLILNRQTLDDSKLYWFACTLLVHIWYAINGKDIPKTAESVSNRFDFQKLFLDIEETFQVSLRQESRAWIQSAFLLICDADAESGRIDLKIVSFIFGLLYDIRLQYQQHYDIDHFFLNGLCHHLDRICRVRNSTVQIRNLEKYYISFDPKLSALITQYCRKNKLYDFYLNQEDIAFLKLYFANLYYRKNKEMKRVLLVSGITENLRKRLCMNLESLFNLKITDIISKLEIPFYTKWDKVDLILFTDNIPKYFHSSIPVEKISADLSCEDFFNLNKLNVSPRMPVIDMESLGRELEFLGKENQMKTIEIINRYLENSLLTNRFYGRMENDAFEIISNFEKKDLEIYALNKHLVFAFGYASFEKIQLYYDEEHKKIVLIFLMNDAVKLIQLLLNYASLAQLDFLKNEKNGIASFMKYIVKYT